jgi:hypothetical protein
MVRLIIRLYIAASILGGLALGLMADSATYLELINGISRSWMRPESAMAIGGAYVIAVLPAFIAWLVPASGFAAVAIGSVGTIIVGCLFFLGCSAAWLSFAFYPAALTYLSITDHR